MLRLVQWLTYRNLPSGRTGYKEARRIRRLRADRGLVAGHQTAGAVVGDGRVVGHSLDGSPLVRGRRG
jgi:hypothetical protein